MYAPDNISFVYGRRGTKLSPTLASFVNGVAVSLEKTQKCITNYKNTSVYTQRDAH